VNGEVLVFKDPEGLIQLAEFHGRYLQVSPQRPYLTSFVLVMSEMKDARNGVVSQFEIRSCISLNVAEP
jgi:hypothetical protein